ncbi:PREDICTED: uncharacterized protein LOC108362068 isoform X2 [Rhagoletis zephyria]|uniref:uncharacterized protein LOC108362068 isoform X2 n=1 Tax=Rhagoletis zephyria TaxID=28612 RepID=UPI0008118203|nr:PREDICTED: uncharacterized protein LOC108362068 isoform X2 [Rhagoletis zephyria]
MNYSKATSVIFLSLCVIFAVEAEIILRVDPLALLSATLRTYQKAACDYEQVVIACPRGTSISIEFAQYNNFENKDGFSIDELCPLDKSATHVQAKFKHLLRGSTFGYSSPKISTARYIYNEYSQAIPVTETPRIRPQTDTNMTEEIEENASSINLTVDNSAEICMWPNALQYSLLQTVVEACQKKKHCKFNGVPHYYKLSTSGGPSNSSTASTINVDPCHKRRKIVEVAYKCRPYEFRSKVACHNDIAQLECNPYARIAVYSASFGRTEYESIQCPQPQGVREETCQASYATETVMQICHGRRRCNLAADAKTFGSPCKPNSRMYLKVVYTCDNQERLYLYLLIAGLVGVLACIFVVTGHVLIQKHHSLNSETQVSAMEGSCNVGTTIPNGFNDTISEIDAEIDIQPTHPVTSVSKKENYLTYGPDNGIYSGFESSNRTQNSSLVLQAGMIMPSNAVGARSSTIISSGLCQSPDIIGISSKAQMKVATSNVIGYQKGVSGTPAPAIVIRDIDSPNVPMTQLAQYTIEPTIHASYLINTQGMVNRPSNLQTPPIETSALNEQYSAASSLGRIKTSAFTSVLQQQLSYDGTAPRTLSTGVPVNSQFYYG